MPDVISAIDSRERDEFVYRHGRIIRITHWVNAFAIFALLVTGLGITQLHGPLYWGDAGQDWGPGVEEINGARTDPYPAIARVPDVPWQGMRERMAPPASRIGMGDWVDDKLWSAEVWLRTAMRARDHMVFAWLFLFNGLIYLSAAMASGRFRTLLRPSRRDLSLRKIGHDLWNHVRLRFPKGDEARSYNIIQKYTYLAVIFVVLPLQLLSGLALFPWMDAAFPWYKDVFLGRQSARTIHFTGSLLILAFIVVHLAMVVLSGFGHNMRSMITGWYRLPR